MGSCDEALWGTASEPLASEQLAEVVGPAPAGPAPQGHLTYPCGVRDSAKSGMGRCGNRHLNDLVESSAMNVRGSPETEAIIRR